MEWGSIHKQKHTEASFCNIVHGCTYCISGVFHHSIFPFFSFFLLGGWTNNFFLKKNSDVALACIHVEALFIFFFFKHTDVLPYQLFFKRGNICDLGFPLTSYTLLGILIEILPRVKYESFCIYSPDHKNNIDYYVSCVLSL